MPIVHRFTPCLWFDDQAEEAANYYVGIFKNARIVQIARYGEVTRTSQSIRTTSRCR